MAGIYKIRARDTSVWPFWVDGAKVIEYQNDIHALGGWNPNEPGANTIRPWHYKSTDGGASFSALADLPQGGRTEGGVIVKNDKIYLYGGNDSDTTSSPTVDSYDPVNGWVQVTNDWGLHTVAQYCCFGYCAHKGYAYAMLGQTRSPLAYVNAVYRSSDMINWETVTTSIPAAMQNWIYGCMVSLKGNLYFFGGGRLAGGTPYTMNTKVFKSTDDGTTWVEVADTQLLNSGLWGNATVAGGDTILYISGSDTNNSMSANNRILFSHDGIVWRHTSIIVTGRHATAICPFGNDAFFAGGFGQNDSYLLKRISA